jgi:hypothetical protein
MMRNRSAVNGIKTYKIGAMLWTRINAIYVVKAPGAWLSLRIPPGVTGIFAANAITK